jgi:peptide/nickel transport system substrate-binding protein
MKLESRAGISRAISTTAVIGVLVVLIIAGVVAYYVAYPPGGGTSSSTTTPTTTTTTKATTSACTNCKSTIVIGTTDTVQTTIDPADAYDYFGDNLIYNLGDGLVDYRPGSSQYLPGLATSWNASADGKVWTFNLRQGVTFPDGTPFNANVVNYSVNRQFVIQEAAGPFVGAGIGSFTSVVGSEGALNHTQVMGTYKINFYLNQPLAAFLGMMAFTAMYPVNPNVAVMPPHPNPGNSVGVINYTGNVATENPNGLGPYTLTSWQRQGGSDIEIDLTANTHYWNASGGWPKTQNIVIKFYSDSTSLALALNSGEVDVAFRQLSATDIASFQSNSQFKVWNGPGAFIQYLVFNQKDTALTQTVRQAIAYALNRSAIVTNVFQGAAQNLYSMIPIGMVYHTDAFKTMYGDANDVQAEALLTQAGYSTTNKLIVNLTYPTGHYASTDGISAQIKQALEKTGMVTVNVSPEPWSNYKASTQADQLQVYIYGWYPDYVDPYDYTYPFFPADGQGFLHTNWVNSTMNSLVAQILATSDSTQLTSLYSHAQNIVTQAAPVIPLFQGSSIAVSTPKVSGIVLDITTIFRYYTLQATT